MQGYVQPTVPDESVSCLALAPLPAAVFWARRYAEAALQAWRLRHEDIETAQLLVSELVTNSVRFTGEPLPHVIFGLMAEVKPISLILRHRPDILIIEVCDPDPTPPILADAGPTAGTSEAINPDTPAPHCSVARYRVHLAAVVAASRRPDGLTSGG